MVEEMVGRFSGGRFVFWALKALMSVVGVVYVLLSFAMVTAALFVAHGTVDLGGHLIESRAQACLDLVLSVSWSLFTVLLVTEIWSRVFHRFLSAQEEDGRMRPLLPRETILIFCWGLFAPLAYTALNLGPAMLVLRHFYVPL